MGVKLPSVLKRDLIARVKMLKRLEWAGYAQGQGSGFMSSGGDGAHYPACPVCRGIKPRSRAEGDFMDSAIGHERKCVLSKLLRESV